MEKYEKKHGIKLDSKHLQISLENKKILIGKIDENLTKGVDLFISKKVASNDEKKSSSNPKASVSSSSPQLVQIPSVSNEKIESVNTSSLNLFNEIERKKLLQIAQTYAEQGKFKVRFSKLDFFLNLFSF